MAEPYDLTAYEAARLIRQRELSPVTLVESLLQRIRRLVQHDMAQVFQRVECLLMPAAPGPAPQGLASTGDPSFNALASFTGVPAITIPSGLNAAGMPLAVQLLGPALADDRLLAAARWCEATLDVTLVPALPHISPRRC